MPMPVKRMQAKRLDKPDSGFGTLYGHIDDFNWVEGHRYRVLVEEHPRDPFMADGFPGYKLHKIISDEIV